MHTAWGVSVLWCSRMGNSHWMYGHRVFVCVSWSAPTWNKIHAYAVASSLMTNISQIDWDRYTKRIYRKHWIFVELFPVVGSSRAWKIWWLRPMVIAHWHSAFFLLFTPGPGFHFNPRVLGSAKAFFFFGVCRCIGGQRHRWPDPCRVPYTLPCALLRIVDSGYSRQNCLDSKPLRSRCSMWYISKYLLFMGCNPCSAPAVYV